MFLFFRVKEVIAMSDIRYKAEDLKVGMIVSRYELEEVYDLYVYLKDYNSATRTGEIIHLCKVDDWEHDAEIAKISKEYGGTTVHFRSSVDADCFDNDIEEGWVIDE